MKKSLAFVSILGMVATQAHADAYYTGNHVNGAVQTLEFHVDSMPTSLSSLPEQNALAAYTTSPQPKLGEWTVKDSETKGYAATNALAVNNSIKPYKFMDDMTFVGVPLFVAGIIAKSEKASFRQNYNSSKSNTRLITNFHNEIDNYTQYVPLALAAGLNFAGVEGRSDHWRFLASGAMSYAIMAAIVNPIKYSAKEMRPDGSTRNSWPSGHTATAFVSATILHKEYGLTRSPWYSVAGYAVATATGVMRVLNNRHWVSDVLSGAGIGIVSTELAYGISDLIFKGKHLKRNDLSNTANIIENPSFFSVSMGIGLGSRNMTFSGADLDLQEETADDVISNNVELKFGAATVVGAEGAYFFNKYIGIGGRLKVRSTPIKGWSNMTSTQRNKIEKMYEAYSGSGVDWMPVHDLTIESDHITEFSANAGVYFNLPLSRRLALGSKLLIGRSVIQDLDVDAHFSGTSVIQTYDKVEDPNTGKVTETPVIKGGTPYDISWDYMTVSGNNTLTYGTGLSLTYAYKSNFSWKVFVDYDFTRKRYTMDLNTSEFLRVACFGPDAAADGTLIPQEYNNLCDEYKERNIGTGGTNLSSTIKKNMNNFVIGAAFTVSF